MDQLIVVTMSRTSEATTKPSGVARALRSRFHPREASGGERFLVIPCDQLSAEGGSEAG